MLKKSVIVLSIIAILATGCASASSNGNKNSTESKNNTTQSTKDEGSKKEEGYELPQFSELKEGEEIATIITNMGEMKVRFFPEYAPSAVENFLTHAKNDYYDGLKFHRVIKDFMIQGGDPLGDGTGGESIWEKPFEDEFTPALRHFKGALSMAKAQPHGNGSQFFIVQANKADEQIIKYFEGVTGKYMNAAVEKYKEVGGTPHLDNQHTVFGQVFEGLDIIDKIASVETAEKNIPKEDIVVKDIKVEKYKK